MGREGCVPVPAGSALRQGRHQPLVPFQGVQGLDRLAARPVEEEERDDQLAVAVALPAAEADGLVGGLGNACAVEEVQGEAQAAQGGEALARGFRLVLEGQDAVRHTDGTSLAMGMVSTTPHPSPSPEGRQRGLLFI